MGKVFRRAISVVLVFVMSLTLTSYNVGANEVYSFNEVSGVVGESESVDLDDLVGETLNPNLKECEEETSEDVTTTTVKAYDSEEEISEVAWTNGFIEETSEDVTTTTVKAYDSEEENSEVTWTNDFIEETSEGQNINDYEREIFERINEIIENSKPQTVGTDEEDSFEALESAINELISINAEESVLNDKVLELDRISVATNSEIEELEVLDELIFSEELLKVGNHSNVASPSVIINSTYDRYEIYTGENAGTVKISDNNGIYYNDNTKVRVLRDMVDSNNNSPILLNLASNVQFFNFDNSNDNYILLPEGFVEDLVVQGSGNGYFNPQGISKLDHIKVELTFNSSYLGKYELFEYGVLYYLSCYEGVLGEYYYYDPSTTDIDRAATFYVNNKIMDRTYNIVSEYYYKSPSGEQLSFKPTWVLNSDNLIGINREGYAKQWVNFPYFLIKTGEKYWNIRESIEQSTYLSEYLEGYYEQYLTERPYGNIAERLVALDDVYKTEEDLLNDNISLKAVHPYVKSDAIIITGNFREDTITDANKLRAGGVLSYDTSAVLCLNVSDYRAKSVQVYLNGEKLISNNNHGLYTLTNGECQFRIDGSKLLNDENSRNVVSFILLNEEGNYLTDSQGRIINSYISLIRNSSINKQSYIISFNTNGGTAVTSVSVEEGNKLSLPTNPIKGGKNFLGWYNDIEFQDKFDANEYIIGEKVLYALWGDEIPIPNKSIGYSGDAVGGKGSGGVGGGSSGGGSGGGNGGGGNGGGGGIDVNGISIGTKTNDTLNPLTAIKNADSPSVANAEAIRGNWVINGEKWHFTDNDGNDYKDRWAYIDLSNDPINENANWYRFDENGDIITGYYFVEDKVYCFDDGSINKGDEGKMLVGWHWLPSFDGGYCCYYFNTSDENRGILEMDDVTSDGYRVDIFGRWCDSGQVQRRSYR